jgi:hypothetical protein
MPKVGIMADVSSEVFEDVVSPAKAEKRFNKLVSNLLETYHSNDTVRAIVDGKAEESHIQGLSSLQEQLAQATNSVNTMGIYGDSLQMSLDSAKEEFSDVADTEKKGSGVSTDSADFESFKKEILESQQSFMDRMESMLSSVLGGSNNVTPNQTVSKPLEDVVKEVTPKETTPKKEDSFAPIVSLPSTLGGDSEEESSSLFEVVEDDSSTADVSGTDVLASLVGDSNSFSFGG